ncbi:MAG: hypothetical protein IT422_04790 [Pirellulaceae bacterium]|jgi:hypothetical protein|nr:hypothetical protein [Pirellulaceae bacterium]
MISRIPTCLTLWALTASCFAVSATLHAQDEADEQTVHSMCRLGLATSAVDYVNARRELASSDRDLAAKWTMLLMECHAQAGLYVGRSEDDNGNRGAAEQWGKCRSVYDTFIDSEQDNPRLPWLQWQLARCELLRAQSDAARYLAAPASVQPREQALQRIRRLLVDLEALEDDLANRQPLAARGSGQDEKQAPAEQLAALVVDVGLLRCEALLLRTRLYPRGSADRIASATEVDQQAAVILQRTEPVWPSRAQLQVAAATARLDLGQSAEAVRELEQLANSANNRLARLRAALAAIEHIAYSQAGGNSPSTSADQPTSISRGYVLLEHLQLTESGPEIDLAHIQLALAEVARTSGSEKQAAMQALVAQAQQLGKRYGDYWRSRADALLVGSLETSSTDDGSSLTADLVLVEVRQLLAAGDHTAAIEKLVAFRDHEAAAGRGESALRSASQAAALLARQQQWTAASASLAPISRRLASLAEAPDAHRQAIYYQSQAMRASTTDPQASTDYEALLKDQLSQWPDAPATDEVTQWLSLWLTQAGRHDELASVYLHRAMACGKPANIERALLDWLGELLHLPEAEQLQQQLSALRGARARAQWPTTPAWSEAALIFAEVTAPEPSDEQLQQAVHGLSRLDVTSVDGAWKQMLLAVRWLHAIRTEQRPADLPPELLQWQPDQLPSAIRQGLARSLIAAIDETPAAGHAQWAQRVKLDATWRELLLDSPSPAVQASGFRLLAWSGNVSGGLDGLIELSQRAGRAGGGVQIELANALADSGPNRWQQSSDLAKTVVANSAAGSELNQRARWRLVKNLLLLGEIAEAQQMAKLWLATQPAQASLWKTRFESVLSKPASNN